MPPKSQRAGKKKDSIIDLAESSQSSQSQQSQSKNKRKTKNDDVEASQASTQGGNQMSTAEFNRKTAEMVRYMLFADRKKIGIKRPDLTRNVLKEQARSFGKVFDEACKKIKNIYGYDVLQMESEDGKPKGYILVNSLADAETFEFMNWKDENCEMGLLMIILCLIFMNEGSINEVALWHVLRKFGLTKNEKHDLFNDVDKLIAQEFVKTNYLERLKTVGNEGPVYQYRMGARSLKEVSKRQILEFVTEIYGVESIESWKVQYQEVQADEEKVDVEMSTVE